MEDRIDSLEAVLPVDEEPLKRGRPVVAWVVIVLLVAVICWLRTVGKEKRVESGEDRAALVLVKLQGRFFVGVADVWGKPTAQQAVEALNTGPLEQRFRYVVLHGELAGPKEARHALRDLNGKINNSEIELTPKQRRIQSILNRLYADYGNDRWEAPSLSANDRELLRQDLGWFGDLALNPARGPGGDAREAVLRPARRTMWVLFAELAGLAFLSLAGLVGLVVAFVLILTGAWRARFRSGTPYGGVYAETFALWMALFIILSIGAHFLPAGDSQLIVQGMAMVLSLSALAWPVVRGVSWRQVRQDLGWIKGEQRALEPALGAVGYVMTVPMFAIALLGSVILLSFWQRLLPAGTEDEFGPTNQPSHPVVEYLGGTWWGPIQIILIACVVAPVVEETMFRGVLYRHLREASAPLGLIGSILLSGMISSFIFAVIHPQGILLVPPLMALAFGFSLIREWRGTVMPCMVAHALHNGLFTVSLILAAR